MRLGRLLPVALLLATAAAASTQLNERVLVVVNPQSKASKAVARHYMQARGIPQRNLCSIKLYFRDLHKPPESYVHWQDFEPDIRKPIRKCVQKLGADTILYIVFSYHTPYRLTERSSGYGVSMDQYVADLWDDVGDKGRVFNPYFARSRHLANLYQPYVSLADYRSQDGARRIYSVWRLDAPTPELAKGLVDKAIAAERGGLKGQVCIDRRGGGDMAAAKAPEHGYSFGDWELFRAAQFFRQAGLPVLEDAREEEIGMPPAPPRCDDAIFYSGWYSIDDYKDAFSWKPGAIGFHLDSGSLSSPRSGKSWSVEALRRGVTVTSGAITEPYLQGLPRPAGIARNLLEGANVGDAFLRNTESLRWQILNIGDPLYRPFPGGRAPFNGTPAPAASR